MDCQINSISIKETGYFSKLVNDYVTENRSQLASFYKYEPNDVGLKAAVAARLESFSIDRDTLVTVLKEQYASLTTDQKVLNNIELLADEKTVTICTAHQPNLMTGHLYTFYKIIHTVTLADYLKSILPDYNFVPVFYVGSEDNDLEELGNFHYEGREYVWNTTQEGAVGRMKTDDLKSLIADLFRVLGPNNENTQHVKQLILDAYQSGHSIATATRMMINDLLGYLGVVTIDPDDARLKANYTNIIRTEIFEPIAYEMVAQTSNALNAAGYKAQAHTRTINFFYLKDQIRNRIEHIDADTFEVVNTDIRFTKSEMEAEIAQYPERFSPNVILRGLYQETILPNVAFIGGGSEVAYWMQLKPVFEHYNVFYPAIILRQSVMITNDYAEDLRKKLGLSIPQQFIKTDPLIDQYVSEHTANELNLSEQQLVLSNMMESITQQVTAVDKNLANSAQAALTKMKHQFEILEKKIFRAEKRNQSVAVERIHRLKESIFPNDGLQERHDNFLSYYIQNGRAMFDALHQHTAPFGDKFLILQFPQH